MIDVTLVYNKANAFGLAKDVEGITKALGGAGYSFRHSDPLEPPVPTDIAIHLERPTYVWMPWAAKNILVVNPEWFQADAWRPYMRHFDVIVYKDSKAAEEAIAAGLASVAQVRIVPWGCDEPAAPEAKKGNGKAAPTGSADTGFVWFVGGSQNKRAAVPPVVGAWREDFPPLRIYSTESLAADLSGTGFTGLPPNVRCEVRDLDAATRSALGRFFRGHICCSRAEGFGYTAAEAEWHGAFTLLSDIPVYRSDYAGQPGCAFLPITATSEELAIALADAIALFESADFGRLAVQRKERAYDRWESFCTAFKAVVDTVAATGAKKIKHLPPLLNPADCPSISVVTLLYNRRKFFDLACHSLMVQDYPKDKIEWVIVEDSDDPAEDASDRVMAVAAAADPVRVEYIPLGKKTTVAQKRNIACARASAPIILMMDDDDHYPETSFRRRVAWLTKHPWAPRAVAATTIACYDLLKGISAVNVPPFDLPLSQRISEATLTFYKSWWEERYFPSDVQIGEGEGFLAGREVDVLEIPPQQAIVAFSHGKNASSRRVPEGEGVKPGCFWGFPREFLEFVHGLAGVKVVEDKASSKRKTA